MACHRSNAKRTNESREDPPMFDKRVRMTNINNNSLHVDRPPTPFNDTSRDHHRPRDKGRRKGNDTSHRSRDQNCDDIFSTAEEMPPLTRSYAQRAAMGDNTIPSVLENKRMDINLSESSLQIDSSDAGNKTLPSRPLHFKLPYLTGSLSRQSRSKFTSPICYTPSYERFMWTPRSTLLNANSRLKAFVPKPSTPTPRDSKDAQSVEAKCRTPQVGNNQGGMVISEKESNSRTRCPEPEECNQKYPKSQPTVSLPSIFKENNHSIITDHKPRYEEAKGEVSKSNQTSQPACTNESPSNVNSYSNIGSKVHSSSRWRGLNMSQTPQLSQQHLALPHHHINTYRATNRANNKSTAGLRGLLDKSSSHNDPPRKSRRESNYEGHRRSHRVPSLHRKSSGRYSEGSSGGRRRRTKKHRRRLQRPNSSESRSRVHGRSRRHLDSGYSPNTDRRRRDQSGRHSTGNSSEENRRTRHTPLLEENDSYTTPSTGMDCQYGDGTSSDRGSDCWQTCTESSPELSFQQREHTPNSLESNHHQKHAHTNQNPAHKHSKSHPHHRSHQLSYPGLDSPAKPLLVDPDLRSGISPPPRPATPRPPSGHRYHVTAMSRDRHLSSVTAAPPYESSRFRSYQSSSSRNQYSPTMYSGPTTTSNTTGSTTRPDRSSLLSPAYTPHAYKASSMTHSSSSMTHAPSSTTYRSSAANQSSLPHSRKYLDSTNTDVTRGSNTLPPPARVSSTRVTGHRGEGTGSYAKESSRREVRGHDDVGALTSDLRSTRITNGRRYQESVKDKSQYSPPIAATAACLPVYDYHGDSNRLRSISCSSIKEFNTSNINNNANEYIKDYSSLLSQSKRRKGIVGLKNLGNTCFMNSIIQCMSNVRLLHEYVFNGEYKQELQPKSKQKGALMKVYANLIDNMWSTSETAISPDQFKSQLGYNAPIFLGFRQHDSQEFLIYLLDGLHADINKGKTKKELTKDEQAREDRLSADQKSKSVWNRYILRDNSKIIDIFVGQFRSTLHCNSCGHESHTFDPFMNLSLPINGKLPSTLNSCLAQFTKEEKLDGNEKPKCEGCKHRTSCTKSLKIQRLPKVLIVHLKRFDCFNLNSKLDTQITYPLHDFDLSPYLTKNNTNNCTYDLFAISCHVGSVYSGHYTAHTKHPYTGHWHTFNDQSARTSNNYHNNPEVYVLFYEMNDNEMM